MNTSTRREVELVILAQARLQYGKENVIKVQGVPVPETFPEVQEYKRKWC